VLGQYGSVKARDAINRRLYKGLILVKTAIYRVFALQLAACHQKTLTEPYWVLGCPKDLLEWRYF
jgi:hypothetical protein